LFHYVGDDLISILVRWLELSRISSNQLHFAGADKRISDLSRCHQRMTPKPPVRSAAVGSGLFLGLVLLAPMVLATEAPPRAAVFTDKLAEPTIRLRTKSPIRFPPPGTRLTSS
jgi:hypothetical protein